MRQLTAAGRRETRWLAAWRPRAAPRRRRCRRLFGTKHETATPKEDQTCSASSSTTCTPRRAMAGRMQGRDMPSKSSLAKAPVCILSSRALEYFQRYLRVLLWLLLLLVCYG